MVSSPWQWALPWIRWPWARALTPAPVPVPVRNAPSSPPYTHWNDPARRWR